jgi:hypothetical protein
MIHYRNFGLDAFYMLGSFPLHEVNVVCSKKNPFSSELTPFVVLSHLKLRALCRAIGPFGMLSPARWRDWNISELAGFWVGRPRIFPPQFWMFESNTAYRSEWLVVGCPDACRYYVREFGALDSTDLLIEGLRNGGVKQFSGPQLRR